MGKFKMGLTYVTTIAFGVVFIYLVIVTGAQNLFVFGGVFLVLLAAYLAWSEYFRRERL
jgi:hypothetical protein